MSEEDLSAAEPGRQSSALSGRRLTPTLHDLAASRLATVFPSPIRWIIFDADDTCWQTQPLFERGIADALEMLAEAGFTDPDARDVFDAIERDRLSSFGYSRHRLPYTFVDLYACLCARHGRTIDGDLFERLQARGYAVHEDWIGLRPGIRDVLQTLHSWGIKCALYTRGDPAVQNARLDRSGLRPFFAHVAVVPDKNVTRFHELLDRLGVAASETIMVGNSAKYDINPAVEAGARLALYCPTDGRSWGPEIAPLKPNGFRQIADLTEIIEFAEEFFAPAPLRAWVRAYVGRTFADSVDPRRFEDALAALALRQTTHTILVTAHRLEARRVHPAGTDVPGTSRPYHGPGLRVGLSGPPGCGKSALAELSGLPMAHIGDGIKQEVAEIFRALGYADMTADIVHAQRSVFRPVLQTYGMLKRYVLGPDVWARRLVRQTSDWPSVICDDPRTKGDAEVLRRSGFTLIRIEISPREQMRRLVKRTLAAEGITGEFPAGEDLDALIERARQDERTSALLSDASDDLSRMRTLVRRLSEGLQQVTETDLDDYPFAYRIDGEQTPENMLRDLRAIFSRLVGEENPMTFPATTGSVARVENVTDRRNEASSEQVEGVP